jgi:hypothetical protein
LHCIESSTVRREVEAAGSKFDSESSTLANPADPAAQVTLSESGRLPFDIIRPAFASMMVNFTPQADWVRVNATYE